MREWNDGQKAVLDSLKKDLSILVSAAAGSGKTAVLVERIVQSVEQGLCGIDEILVVTFTKAAAAQMKGKITRLLEERAYESGDPRLLRQLALAANADISTIDSFCNRVVRENFQAAGVDPGFEIMDTGEYELLKEEVLDTVLDQLYREKEFSAFAQAFIRRTYDDSKLRELIFRIFQVSEGFAEPEQWIRRSVIRSTDTPEQVMARSWAVDFLTIIRNNAREAMAYLEQEIPIYEAVPAEDKDRRKAADKILDILNADLTWFQSYADAEGLAEVAAMPKAAAPRFMKSSYQRVFDPAAIEILAEKRKEYRDVLSALVKGISADSLQDEFACHAVVEEQLIRAVELFKEALRQEKQRKKKYDFNDVAHFAYRILYDPEKGEVTAVGKRYAEKYRYIYIDEYQDGSDLQEHILSSVARRENGVITNIFMVGDVKQSIYRFRQARPQLFLEKERDYQKPEVQGEVLFLNENYRSRDEILAGTNYIFRKVMREDFGGIRYDENVQLNPPKGRKTPAETVLPEFLILDTAEQEETAEDQEEERDEDRNEDRDGEPKRESPPVSSEVLEARMIGTKILELVQGDSGYSFRDIVILQRSVSGSGPMLREYERMGIPVQLEDPKAYFDAEEVVVILSVLQVIDNSRQDIPYAAMLLSEIGGCTDAEAAYLSMQRSGRGEALFDTAERILAAPEEGQTEEGQTEGTEETDPVLAELRASLLEKLKVLHEKLRVWKRESLYLSIAQLIDRILEDTGYRLVAAAMPRGERRESNLMQLMFKAEDFEKSGNHGLFYFLRYIEKCKIHEVEFGDSGSFGEQSDAVRICTIHSSKGLEYPVVFVARLGKSFNKMDMRRMVTVSADYGIAPNRIRKIGNKYWLSEKGILKSAVNQLEELESLYEELRLLYVAMTRAEERLFLTGKSKGFQEKWVNAALQPSPRRDVPYSILSTAGSYMDFVEPVLLMDTERTTAHFRVEIFMKEEILREREEHPVLRPAGEQDTLLEGAEEASAEAESELSEEMRQLATVLKASYEYQYPYQAAVQTRTKLSVSEVKHEAMERKGVGLSAATPERAAATEHAVATSDGAAVTPERAAEGEAPATRGESKVPGVSGTDYGTAVHKLMELLPFAEIDSMDTMKKTLKELLQTPFFTEDLRKAVRVDTIKQFYSDDPDSLFQRMRRADQRNQLFKEQQFLIGLPASRLGQEIPLAEAEGEDTVEPRISEGESLRFATDEPVVLQGIIDGFFLEEDEEGNAYAVLMDYKTDRVESPEILKERYMSQLSLYRETLEDILQVPVREMLLYGFAKGLGEIRL